MISSSQGASWAHYVRCAKALASSNPETHDPAVESAKQLADNLLQLKNAGVVPLEMTASGEKRELSFATDLFPSRTK